MDDPSVSLSVTIDHLEREHREHELSFDGFEQAQELFHVPFVERVLVVSAVGVDIRRIDEMKGIGRIVAGDHVERISVFQRNVFQSKAQPFRELIFGVAQFF